ncbi:23S rRNA (cytosine1962-C5)-methyltransferase [Altererythrobacter atlanticus]|uniref:23S rRNA m(2)G2445 methyltransferase n=1 Tax=Croceibacterium atlanticum TaxID=1267766 RepID=A0A0F7KRT9_9SPHN|nr:class I SAM-dependent methyltransferase [Croceibacterium atlanticum]AKH42319.1 23S rRNA m(2)G2445 methyltransferase [Croceibacterium atlanticum]MBB5731096.1 23S rRNA (cytosine1962-C5)-methyltransferase [Croceibacterium atlanticum]
MAELKLQPLVMTGEGWADYGLVDSGHGRKLERYGPYRFIRPEPQAMWSPRLPDWDAHGEFVPGSDEDGGGRWHYMRDVPADGWPLAWNEAKFTAQCTPFRHLGFFPDMAPVWDWMRGRLGYSPLDRHPRAGGDDEGTGGARGTLNLFGYTGVGTLALSECGPVTHVDASKKSVAQARENAALCGMEDRPIRWLVDDAAKFAAREVRRERLYDGIILDPPKFGRGPKNETWRLEESLPGLIGDCRQLLDADSRFLFLTVYAVRMSSLALGGLLAEHFAGLPGTIEHGELAVREDALRQAQDDRSARLLPTAIFARWSGD